MINIFVSNGMFLKTMDGCTPLSKDQSLTSDIGKVTYLVLCPDMTIQSLVLGDFYWMKFPSKVKLLIDLKQTVFL